MGWAPSPNLLTDESRRIRPRGDDHSHPSRGGRGVCCQKPATGEGRATEWPSLARMVVRSVERRVAAPGRLTQSDT
jgi:hypothetical protein